MLLLFDERRALPVHSAIITRLCSLFQYAMDEFVKAANKQARSYALTKTRHNFITCVSLFTWLVNCSLVSNKSTTSEVWKR
jgi:hypothetical protein